MSNIFNSNNAYEKAHKMPDNYMQQLLYAEGFRKQDIFYEDINNHWTMFGGITSTGLAEYFSNIEKHKRKFNRPNIKFDSPIITRLYEEAYKPIMAKNKGKDVGDINWEVNNIFTYAKKGKTSFKQDYDNKKITDEQVKYAGYEAATEIGSFNLRIIESKVNPGEGENKQHLGPDVFSFNDKGKNEMGIMCHLSPEDCTSQGFIDAIRRSAGQDDTLLMENYILNTKTKGNDRRILLTVTQPDTYEEFIALDNNRSDALRLYKQCVDQMIHNRNKVNTCREYTINNITGNKTELEQQSAIPQQAQQVQQQEEPSEQKQTRSFLSILGDAFKAASRAIVPGSIILQNNKKNAINKAGENTNDGNTNNNMQ